MEVYSVADIAKMLSVEAETVRRWIRSGKLKATCSSRKGGNVITEEALRDFLNHAHHAKYTKNAASALGMIAATTAVAGGAAGIAVGITGAVSPAALLAGAATTVPSFISIIKELFVQGISSDVSKGRTAIERVKAEIQQDEQRLLQLQQESRELENRIAQNKQLLEVLNLSISEAEEQSKKERKM